MNTPTRHVTKVLPFDTPQGHVPGHEIARVIYNFGGGEHNPIERVVFWDFDDEAQMGIEISVHWTEWTKYAKRKWPHAGRVVAVLCRNGLRLDAEAMFCGHSTDKSYTDAPLLCRDEFRIRGLCNHATYLEVVGVYPWLCSRRDAEATAKHLVDPWARDNAEFYKRYPQEAAA